MGCEQCRRFMLAASHIGRLDDALALSESEVRDYREHVVTEGVCTEFTLNGVRHTVTHSQAGFTISRQEQQPLSFLHWECQNCGVVCKGEWDATLIPFTAFRMEMIRQRDVIVNLPHGADAIDLSNVNVPKQLTANMILRSFGTTIRTQSKPLDTLYNICGEFTALMLLVPFYYLASTNVDTDFSTMNLNNLISVHESNYTIVMGSWGGNAISFYIQRLQDGPYRVQIVSDHIAAVYTVSPETEHHCSVQGTVCELSIDLEFRRTKNGYAVLNSGLDWPKLEYCFNHRTLCAVVGDLVRC